MTNPTTDLLRVCCICHREVNAKDVAFGAKLTVDQQDGASHGYCVEHYVRSAEEGNVVDLLERAVECAFELGIVQVWAARRLENSQLELFASIESATKAQGAGTHGPAFKLEISK